MIFKYRGNRNYLHSTTVINYLLSNNFFFEKIRFIKLSQNQLKISKYKTKKTFAQIKLTNNNIIYLIETKKKILQKENYDETKVEKNNIIKNNSIIYNFQKNCNLNIFEILICITKVLNENISSSEGKWLVSEIQLFNIKKLLNVNLKKKDIIKVTRSKYLKPFASENNFFFNSKLIGTAYFVLIKK